MMLGQADLQMRQPQPALEAFDKAVDSSPFSAEGESLKISNETVGHVLKNLGLYTRRLGNAGRGLVLDNATQARAHELGYASEVLPGSDGVSACGHCHNQQLLQTEDVVQEVQVVKIWKDI